MKKIRDINRIILASASPRRRELLTQVGLEFEVMPSDVEEIITKTMPAEIVMELAQQKSRALMEKLVAEDVENGRVNCGTGMDNAEYNADNVHEIGNDKDILIIGADTIVADAGRILGKPKDEADAKSMIAGLSGHSHSVYTGVSLIYLKDGIAQTRTFAEETKVNVVSMTAEQIEWYVSTGESMDKAGAYAIQGLFAEFISGIEGDYSNVVGLPVGRILRECVFS